MDLDVYFDPVCPWCYIGKRRLDRAIREDQSDAITVTWLPFLLNPGIPDEGVDRRQYLNWKFGGESGARSAYAAIEKAAKSESLEFNPGRIARTPSTVDAHRLLIWLRVEGLDVAGVVDGLFAAYFCEGLDISSHEVLAKIAGTAGIDEQLARRLLQGNADRDTVASLDAQARKRGITSIPCHIIDKSLAVHGAQPSDVWLDVFAARRQGTGPFGPMHS